MGGSERARWQRYCEHLVTDADLGFALDVSRVDIDDDALDAMNPAMTRALAAMAALEGGAIANPDENRRVGHYWLRAADLAPDEATSAAIATTRASIARFAAEIHAGPHAHVLHIGIGGSALGPQLLADALGRADDRMTLHFIDNTDPDGIARVLAHLAGELGRTIVTVVSKSGGTAEPRNAMLAVRAAFEQAGLDPSAHFVAVTMEGSALDDLARTEGWLARFPVWDWVGGRMSVTSAAGLVPAALLGIDIDAFLDGAAAMDRLTRGADPRTNPAALLAMAWHEVGNGRGEKDMVVLPYRDRLLLFGRYLQQLVMESLGKELDRGGATVHQGLTVYGNKGATDQHAYVQQLRDGPGRFFVTFIQVLHDADDGPCDTLEVEAGVTAGDYLLGFLEGTRQALGERGRESITITIDRVTPRSLGALIALFERTVGLYAELIDVNAYHQPGVEAGKRAAAALLDLQRRAAAQLGSSGDAETAEAIAGHLGRPDDVETIYKVLEHLAANGRAITMDRAVSPAETTFRSG